MDGNINFHAVNWNKNKSKVYISYFNEHHVHNISSNQLLVVVYDASHLIKCALSTIS